MLLLILGLALWVGVHFWKRIAPDHRASFGEKGKMIVAIGSASWRTLSLGRKATTLSCDIFHTPTSPKATLGSDAK